ncbi:MAG TPA: hypothetical protein VF188_00055 [Longimicrobiales bacterium]
MSCPRIAAVAISAVLSLVLAADALAQVCIGLPADDGQISLQGMVGAGGSGSSYGGRLGMNFNTEYSLDLSIQRPRLESGLGMTISGKIAYEMPRYKPPVCMVFGVEHERRPLADGNEATATMIPIGVGIGKRLGSAKSFSLALYVMPEYLYVVKPDPDGEFESYWDELGARSEGRGTIGLLIATPLLFASGSIAVATRDDFEPALSLGFGVTF